jgi:hypothetical protein
MTDHNEVPTQKPFGYAAKSPKDGGWDLLWDNPPSGVESIALYSSPQPPTEPTRAEDAPHVEPGGEREKLIEAACRAICADTSFGVTWEDILWACSHTEDYIGRTIFEQKRDRVRRIAAGVVDAIALRSSRDAVLEEAVRKATNILATYIVPDSGVSDRECINQLLGVLDNTAVSRELRRLAS